MSDSSTAFHEPVDRISDETLEFRRGILSLMEELEAIDWYQQRIDAAEDEELKKILAHNRDEEMEHAAMSLEWLRRRDKGLDKELREYLFTDGPITETGGHDHAEHNESGSADNSDGSLKIGSLRGMQT